MHAAATAPALAPPVLLPLCLPTGAGSSARPRRAAVRCELAAASASSAAPAAAPGSVAAPRWAQTTVVIPPQRRGCHIITHKIMHAIRSDLSEFKCGLAHLFLHHTSASLTLNENYDPDVQTDTETFLSRIVPEVNGVIFPSFFLFKDISLDWSPNLCLIVIRVHLLHGGIPLKDLMTCQHISNHQCLAVP
uniref:Uncharacterized protein n=1 Tax=Aegilops tauschii subsp. strangulata TaxID=200361 RepID=A0A453T7S4_AEGTS